MPTDYRYEIDIYWSDTDSAYIAEVPDLPGCAADGATYAEALVNAQESIQVWLEAARQLGRPVPTPRQRAHS